MGSPAEDDGMNDLQLPDAGAHTRCDRLTHGNLHEVVRDIVALPAGENRLSCEFTL